MGAILRNALLKLLISNKKVTCLVTNGIGIDFSLKIVKSIQMEKVVRFLAVRSFVIRISFIFVRWCVEIRTVHCKQTVTFE